MWAHLTNDTTSVVVDTTTGAPTIRHWGARLTDADAAALPTLVRRPLANGLVGGPGGGEAPLSLVPEHGSGFPGRPGLAGHRRRGTHWAPRFTPSGHDIDGDSITCRARDDVAQLDLHVVIRLADVLSVRVRVVNTHDDERYLLDWLQPALPVPAHATELLSFTGRWAREGVPHRRPLAAGAHLAENRTGRTSHEHPPLVFVGTHGFGEWEGEVWGAHLAWSGNHQVLAEALPDGRQLVMLGELLHPGEVSLRPGEHYDAPELLATYSPRGLTPASWGFHRHVRATNRAAQAPRPVLLNTWEAVYFDHDEQRLRDLAEAAAAIGVERFVLDDGWFGSRRDDSSGLGDWTVSADAHPHGLAPLIDVVRGLGMDFGIWVEPEMVNPDSEMYRAHPEWTLATSGYEPVLGRNQLVVDLACPDASAHVFDALDRLLADHDIAFVKWDMNRAHAHASGARDAAGTHAQTHAVYRLLDALRARHPDVEFESCASGGGRIDLGVLGRAERVWTSDCNDALERQSIQRWASMFLPAEVIGAHIGPARSHTTGRQHSLALRATTALFGHLGVEWDILAESDETRARLAAAISLHRCFRALLHGGDTVRFDCSDDATIAHGVYAADRCEALVAVVRVATTASLVPPPVRLPGLDPDRRYTVTRLRLDATQPNGFSPVDNPVVASGRLLATVGWQPPAMAPETAILLRLES